MAGLGSGHEIAPVATAGTGLQAERISKRFGETRALSDVSLSVLPGSVHALVGENGAGKSTLGRIIGGVIRPDVGELRLDGRRMVLHSPRDALDRGIACIAQEIALVPALSATENVLLGLESSTAGFVRRARMYDRYREIAGSVGFEVPADTPVRMLPIAQQQQVEILRALSRDAQLIVMDEPTARLSSEETGKLHTVIRALADSGRSVLLISHYLKEVLEVADIVTVLRDGEVVSSMPTSEASESSLIAAMIGRRLGAQFPEKAPPAPDAPMALETRALSGRGFTNVSIQVRAGEIVGLAGLVGAGRSDLGHALAGAAPATSGEILVEGAVRHFDSPAAGRRGGVVLIPESRRDQGLFFLRSIRENVSVASLDRFTRFGIVDRRQERTVSEDARQRVSVAARGETPVAALSGGNQQKLLFARSMLLHPRILVADEPTSGVDVGAKRAIYELLVDLAQNGMGIVFISSEMEEILGLAHRVVVMRSGSVTATLAGDEISESAILQAAFATPGQVAEVV